MEMETTVHELRELMRMQEELNAQIEALKDRVKSRMDVLGVDVLSGTDWKASYKEVTSSRIDTAAMRKELPEIAERYTKHMTTRRFSVA